MLNMTDFVDGFLFAMHSPDPFSHVQLNHFACGIRRSFLARWLRFRFLAVHLNCRILKQTIESITSFVQLPPLDYGALT
jgi:hypothetical protein